MDKAFSLMKIFQKSWVHLPILLILLFWQFSDLPEKVREKWNTFVSGKLAEVNKQNLSELVSHTCGRNIDIFLTITQCINAEFPNMSAGPYLGPCNLSKHNLTSRLQSWCSLSDACCLTFYWNWCKKTDVCSF